MSLWADWSYPTSIRFGAGRIGELVEACAAAGIARPLFVTDPGLAKSSMVDDALAQLRKAGLGVALFSDLKPNPVAGNIDAGIAAFRDGGHDGVVALGGGSALDVGKLIAFMQAQTRPIWDFEDIGDWWTRAREEGIAPIVAVPTTAGTGSEVGRAGVVTNEETHTKKIIFHPLMMPRVVIADPELTVGLPAVLTAGTGMDALAHCLEAYCAPSFHPMSEGIAVEGMRLIAGSLTQAVAEPQDLAARSQMLAAAMMGAVAFQKGLGAIHSLSHPVGALYDTHHGMTNGVFMPYVLAYNRSAIADKIGRLAAWLGLEEASFDGFLGWVLALREEIGVPHTLAELGVDDDRTEEMAAMAVEDPTAASNPVPLDEAGARAILAAAHSGRLEL